MVSRNGDDVKIRKERFELFRTTAEHVCADLNSSNGMNPSGEAYALDPSALEYAVESYFSRVKAFKIENEFGDHRINVAKQAALTIAAILLARPVIVRDNAPDTIHATLGNEWLALQIALVLARIDITILDEALEEEFLFVIRQHHRQERFLILAFELLHRLAVALQAVEFSRRQPWFGRFRFWTKRQH